MKDFDTYQKKDSKSISIYELIGKFVKTQTNTVVSGPYGGSTTFAIFTEGTIIIRDTDRFDIPKLYIKKEQKNDFESKLKELKEKEKEKEKIKGQKEQQQQQRIAEQRLKEFNSRKEDKIKVYEAEGKISPIVDDNDTSKIPTNYSNTSEVIEYNYQDNFFNKDKCYSSVEKKFVYKTINSDKYICHNEALVYKGKYLNTTEMHNSDKIYYFSSFSHNPKQIINTEDYYFIEVPCQDKSIGGKQKLKRKSKRNKKSTKKKSTKKRRMTLKRRKL